MLPTGQLGHALGLQALFLPTEKPHSGGHSHNNNNSDLSLSSRHGSHTRSGDNNSDCVDFSLMPKKGQA